MLNSYFVTRDTCFEILWNTNFRDVTIFPIFRILIFYFFYKEIIKALELLSYITFLLNKAGLIRFTGCDILRLPHSFRIIYNTLIFSNILICNIGGDVRYFVCHFPIIIISLLRIFPYLNITENSIMCEIFNSVKESLIHISHLF